MESQDIRINQWGIDNSFSWDKHDLSALWQRRRGRRRRCRGDPARIRPCHAGFADDALWGFGSSVEAGSIGEGFGDYWAVTVSNVIAPTADPACVADWDSVSYTISVPHCLRRVDTDLHYPADLNGRVHHDGQIWSRALWDIRQALGHVKADTIILEAQFSFAPDTTMPAAAQATVAAASRCTAQRQPTPSLRLFRAGVSCPNRIVRRFLYSPRSL